MAYMMQNSMGNNISKVPESLPWGKFFRGQNSKWLPKILKFVNNNGKAGVNYFTQPIKIHFVAYM